MSNGISMTQPARARGIRSLPPWAWLALGGVLLLPWCVVLPVLRGARPAPPSEVARALSRLVADAPAPASSVAQRLPAGPWGEIEVLPLNLAIPSEFVSGALPEDFRPRWMFSGFTRERLVRFFQAVPLTDAQRHDLLRPSHWREETNGLLVLPEVETVLTLSTNARAHIYAQLVASWDEHSQRFAVPFRPGEMEALLAESRLPADVRALVLQVMYPRGDVLMFGDLLSVLAALPNNGVRHELVRALARHHTYLLRLRVKDRKEVDQLVGYWGTGMRSKDLRPLLDSLARTPGGGWLDVAHLLPPMPRRRLYTYPFASLDPVDNLRDCHWTSVNFFNEIPDDRCTSTEFIQALFREHYEVVTDTLRFGDVIVLTTREDLSVHSAVYVAGNMLFTKNGGNYSNPWLFTTMDEMMRYYNALYGADGGLQTRVYRRRVDGANR